MDCCGQFAAYDPKLDSLLGFLWLRTNNMGGLHAETVISPRERTKKANLSRRTQETCLKHRAGAAFFDLIWCANCC